MKKKAYLEPTYHVVCLKALCDDTLMTGSGQKTDEEVVEDGDDFLGTRKFYEFEWQ